MPPSQISGVPHPTTYEQRKQARAEQEEAIRIRRMNESLQEKEAKYRHLPMLPPQLPGPLYMVQGAPVCNTDDASAAFYQACSDGNLERVRAHVQTSQPSAADLAYGLEEACHNFQLDVVRVLMQLPDKQLHYRCFRRCPECPDDDISKEFNGEPSLVDSQSIFASGHPSLLNLLKALVEFGWHPNQLLGPPQKGKRIPICQPRQEVALHFPRCIVDLDILRFLLEAGADPTIARHLNGDFRLGSRVADYPVERLSGDILEIAVNLGVMEAVNLLISAGAKPAYGIPLHSLARRRSGSSQIKTMDDTRELWQETPEVKYPMLSTRLHMASLLLDHGEDINRLANVWPIVGPYCVVPTRRHTTTAVSHAKDCMDWVFVMWLLENGADPSVHPIYPVTCFPSHQIYRIGTSQIEIEDTYHRIIEEVGETRGLTLKQEVGEARGLILKHEAGEMGEAIPKREMEETEDIKVKQEVIEQ